MKNYNNGGYNKDRGGFRSGRDGGRSGGFKKDYGNNRDRGEVVMHSAVCGECGKSCQVPFRPTQGKPVFCNDCFGNNKNGASSDRAPRNNFDRNDRPKRDFGESALRAERSSSDETLKHLAELTLKVNKLIELVDSMNSRTFDKAKVTEVKKEEIKEIKASPVKTTEKKVVAKKTIASKQSVKVTPKAKGKK